MQTVYRNIAEFNPSRKCNALIVFGDMVTDMISKKKNTPMLTELLIRGQKLNTSAVFVTQSYFQLPKYVRLNCTHFLL